MAFSMSASASFIRSVPDVLVLVPIFTTERWRGSTDLRFAVPNQGVRHPRLLQVFALLPSHPSTALVVVVHLACPPPLLDGPAA